MAQYVCRKCNASLTIPPPSSSLTRFSEGADKDQSRAVHVTCAKCGEVNKITVKTR